VSSYLLRLPFIALALIRLGIIARRRRGLSLGRCSHVWWNFTVLAWSSRFAASYIVHLLWLQRATRVILHRGLPL
jgi:hypothetical protein